MTHVLGVHEAVRADRHASPNAPVNVLARAYFARARVDPFHAIFVSIIFLFFVVWLGFRTHHQEGLNPHLHRVLSLVCVLFGRGNSSAPEINIKEITVTGQTTCYPSLSDLVDWDHVRLFSSGLHPYRRNPRHPRLRHVPACNRWCLESRPVQSPPASRNRGPETTAHIRPISGRRQPAPAPTGRVQTSWPQWRALPSFPPTRSADF